MQKSLQKSPSGHHRTTLSGYIFATKIHVDNRKKNLLSSNISSTCPHNMVNMGPLAAEIGPVVWGTPANFNGFCVLAALLHGTVVVGVSQALWRWTEGATYIRQGGHHVWHWPTFLVINFFHYFLLVCNWMYFCNINSIVIWCLLFTLPVGAVSKYCDKYVLLSVCLFVCLRRYLQNHMYNLYQIFGACCLCLSLSPP